MDGFFEVWQGGNESQKYTRTHVAFGDPIHPLPVDNPERTFESTAELKARVMDMWLEMRDDGQRQAAD